MSIRQSATHPLRDQLEANLAEIFAHNQANEWMKGLLASEQIISAMEIQFDRRFRDDFLTRRLYVDCARMRINVALFQLLRSVKSVAAVVLATDNMDCFVDTFQHARGRRRRITAESETLADWAIICDDVICSSTIAALKAEDPDRFFGTWLDTHGLSFCDAALIDDRADNCEAFANCGGTPIRYKMATDDISDVAGTLQTWLERTYRGRSPAESSP